MPSGLENLEGNRFILRYEHPWGGVAADAAPQDIAPNQFVTCDGLLARNGVLCSTNMYAFDPNYFRFAPNLSDLYWSNIPGIAAIYNINGIMFAIDVNMNVYYYDPSFGYWQLDASPVDISGNPVTFTPMYSCSIMIGGIIYVFDWENGTEFVFTPARPVFTTGGGSSGIGRPSGGPVRPPTTQSRSLRSAVGQPGQMMQAEQGGAGQTGIPQTFVGGQYCMVLDQYLITANVYMPGYTYVDANGDTQTVDPAYYPNGYNWSGPAMPTTFGPIAGTGPIGPTTTLGRSTGYNMLLDVQAEITGCFAMGNVGYILHDQGLTQLNPTGVAIGPFTATLLWGGKDAVGCTYPDTFAIYGYIAVWGNFNNFYMFISGAAPQEICGAAKQAIYRDLSVVRGSPTAYINVSGEICNVGVDNNTPELLYNLYIVYENPDGTLPTNIIVWTYIFRTQTWTRNVINATETLQKISGNSSYNSTISGVATQNLRFSYGQVPEFIFGGIILNMIAPGTQERDSFFLFQYINQDGISSLPDEPPVTNLVFRSEEFQVYRKPTVRGVILRAAGSGTLHVKVGDTDFTDIEVGSQMTDVRLYRSFGMHTNLSPFINITSTNFNGKITKVHAFGTYAEGEPI